MEIVVTQHAERRARERAGLPRKAVRAAAMRAWLNGIAVDVAVPEPGAIVKAHGGGRWVFVVEASQVRCVTVLRRKFAVEDTSGYRAEALRHAARNSRRAHMLRRKAANRG